VAGCDGAGELGGVRGWVAVLSKKRITFSRPLGNLANARAQARHYSGWCDDPDGDGAGLERRIAEHLAGRGSKLTRAALAHGIEITLVAAWRAPLAFEKQLKRIKNAPRLCPICCRVRGQKARHVAPVTQLELPLFAVEPWPAHFDFPTPTASRPDWLEISTLRQWRAAGVVAAGAGDEDSDFL